MSCLYLQGDLSIQGHWVIAIFGFEVTQLLDFVVDLHRYVWPNFSFYSREVLVQRSRIERAELIGRGQSIVDWCQLWKAV